MKAQVCGNDVNCDEKDVVRAGSRRRCQDGVSFKVQEALNIPVRRQLSRKGRRLGHHRNIRRQVAVHTYTYLIFPTNLEGSVSPNVSSPVRNEPELKARGTNNTATRL